MTIALGFMCTDGIVLAADRELSTPTVKIDGPKAWIFAYPREAEDPQLRVCLVGAGDYAFIKFAAEQLDDLLMKWVAQHGAPTIDDVKDVIQTVIMDVHHEHLYPIGQPHERPAIDLLIGLWLKSGRMRLARTSLTAVTKVWNYEAVGIGSDLANFLVRRFYADRIPISSAMFWASYVLMHAKKYVPGCGGPSDVIAMFKSGTTGALKKGTIATYEQFATEFEAAIHPAFMGGADESVKQDLFMQCVDELAVKLKVLRDPTFIQKQAEQVRRDITLRVAPQHMAVSDNWIVARMAAEEQNRKPTPNGPPADPEPEEK
jgi:hypothetical protein